MIASAGVPRKEYQEKTLSDELEKVMEGRGMYLWREGNDPMMPISDHSGHVVSCAMPIVSEGDVVGCVASLVEAGSDRTRDISAGEMESKLILTAAGFLGKQMEG